MVGSEPDQFAPLLVSGEVQEIERLANEIDRLGVWTQNAFVLAQDLVNQRIVTNNAKQAILNHQRRYTNAQKEAFGKIQAKFESQKEQLQALQTEFDNSLDNLTGHKLDPVLVSEERQTLADLFDQKMFKQWKSNYNKEIVRLEGKIGEVRVEIERLDVSGDLDFENSVGFDFHSALTQFAQTRLEAVKSLISQTREALSTIHNAVSRNTLNLAQVKSTLAQYLTSITQSRGEISSHLDEIIFLRDQAGIEFITTIKSVMQNTSRIRDVIKSQIEMLGNLLKRNEQNLNFLVVPKNLPDAYRASLAEVSRRRLFLQRADHLRQKLNQLITVEVDYRREFLQAYRQILPSNFIPQLSAGPSIVYIPNDPDRSLPEISVEVNFPRKDLYENPNFEKLTQENHDLKSQLVMREESLEDCRKEYAKLTTDLQSQIKQIEGEKLKLQIENQELMKSNQQLLEETKTIIDPTLTQSIAFTPGEIPLASSMQFGDLTKSIMGSKVINKGIHDLQNLTADQVITEFEKVIRRNHEYKQLLRKSIIINAFKPGFLALFFPHINDAFMAFNNGVPNYFLDFSNIPEQHRMRTYLIGKIQAVSQHKASSESNPFRLDYGETYHLVTIDPLI